jgi:hypothetical protein
MVSPAKVGLTLETYEKWSEDGQKVWRYRTAAGTKQPVPVDFEIYSKPGMVCLITVFM